MSFHTKSPRTCLLLLVAGAGLVTASPAHGSLLGAVKNCAARVLRLADVPAATATPPVFNSPNYFRDAQRMVEAKYVGSLLGGPFRVGGQSFVFTVEWIDGPQYTVKVPVRIPEGDKFEVLMSSFAREAALLLRIERELVEVRDSFPSVLDELVLEGKGRPNLPVLVMTRASRGGLSESFTHFGPDKPFAETFSAWLGVLRALAAVFDAYAISHGDIKSGNILVHESLAGGIELWVSDWGGYSSPLDAPRFRAGTTVYLSRASLAGTHSPWLDDVRGVKLLLLEMLAGKTIPAIAAENPESCETVRPQLGLEEPHGTTDISYLNTIPKSLREKIPPRVLETLEREQANVAQLYEELKSLR